MSKMSNRILQMGTKLPLKFLRNVDSPRRFWSPHTREKPSLFGYFLISVSCSRYGGELKGLQKESLPMASKTQSVQRWASGQFVSRHYCVM